ncbi:potassium channel family protein [Geminicoccus flavidas]|uniref:potassium channel family protein n=1 Tax=Geminicoccus flavidas TaxID=2506407 RepID=UPI0013585D1B|nr:potassium channel family protein [Geminicoccus flavidas]
MQLPSHAVGRLRTRLRHLFYGHRRDAVVFQMGLLALDLGALAYFLATTFVAPPWTRWVDLLLGALLLLEFLSRLAAHRHPMRYLDNAAALIDIVVIVSLFLSALVGNLAFLRVLRTVRLMRSYNVLGQLKRHFLAVRRNEEVITAALDLAVFMLMVASIVYVTQRPVNPEIANFLDALYFTVTTLSTTGFGDVTLVGWPGRLLSMAIMIVGISLFFRLAQAVFRPGGKVRHPCPRCGLQRHDRDAVHCKACGGILNISNDEG